MAITHKKVDVYERLAELALKVVLFFFVLIGVAVLTAFFIYCVLNDKGTQAKAISGYGDLVFFTAFGKLIWNFFVKSKPVAPGATIMPPNVDSKDESLRQ